MNYISPTKCFQKSDFRHCHNIYVILMIYTFNLYYVYTHVFVNVYNIYAYINHINVCISTMSAISERIQQLFIVVMGF